MPASATPIRSAAVAKERLGAALAASPHLRLVPPPELLHAVDLATRTPEPVAVAPAVPVKPSRLAPLRQRLARFAVVRHAAVGTVLTIMEGIRNFMGPAAFCVRHAPWIAMGLLTFTVPALIAGVLWRQVPGWSDAFPLNSFLSWGFLTGLTMAVGFTVAVATVMLQGVFTGLVQAARQLTRKGEKAFD